MDIMAARNLDNTGCGCQTLLDDPKLLGRGPPPSPLRTRQNRNRRHVLLICLQINEQTISRSNTVQEGGPYRGLTVRRSVTAPKDMSRTHPTRDALRTNGLIVENSTYGQPYDQCAQST
jgi:hypothetical protein